jgi:hypothetical protein
VQGRKYRVFLIFLHFASRTLQAADIALVVFNHLERGGGTLGLLVFGKCDDVPG